MLLERREERTPIRKVLYDECLMGITAALCVICYNMLLRSMLSDIGCHRMTNMVTEVGLEVKSYNCLLYKIINYAQK